MKLKELGSIRNTVISFALIILCFVAASVCAAPIDAVQDTRQPDTQCINGLFAVGECPDGYELDATDLVTGEKYNVMRSDFLNIDTETLSVLSFNDLSETELSDVMTAGGTSYGFRWDELTGSESWFVYGSKHTCTNADNETAACFLNIGGSDGGIFEGNPCGTATGNNITNAQNPAYQCQETKAWSSSDFWLNAYDNTDFIMDSFYPTEKKAVNRLCVEMEFPYENLTLNSTDIAANPAIGQVVNPNDLHANLRTIKFEWGTYMSPRLNGSGTTTDDEVGGTYQDGGSHFYHKSSSYSSYPTDKVYAVNDRTVVACVGDIPANVRSGMRAAYIANPLLTIGGVDDNGITNAGNYLNHVTRMYFRFADTNTSTATYPMELKINKFFMMYEDNDIFAATTTGATISEEMVESNVPAYHPFTIYNNANELRTYRVFLNSGSVQPFTGSNASFMLYEDTNANGVLDVGESEVIPYSTLNLSANTNKSFILKHTVDFSAEQYVFLRHGKNMKQATFSIQEVDTLRSASFAVRTWEGDATAQTTKEAFFTSARYPSATSEWYLNRQYNAELNPSTNPNLVRNTRDYIMAKTKGGW